jgi:hypothetical protein
MCVDVGLPHDNGNTISLPYLLIEFRARHTLDKCPVRPERGQPSLSGRPVEVWLQNLKGEIGDAATDAVAAGRHEKIDVVVIKLAIARLTCGRKRHGFGPLPILSSVIDNAAANYARAVRYAFFNAEVRRSATTPIDVVGQQPSDERDIAFSAVHPTLTWRQFGAVTRGSLRPLT